MKRHSIWLGALLLCSLGAGPFAPLSSAQTVDRATSGTATAEALFDRGREELRLGNAPRACALLEASQRVEAATGTQLLLAHCYEQLGRSASAWALFREVASRSPDNQKREQIARVRADALETTLARLELLPGEHSVTELEALQILRDDVVVPASALGVAVPVDPGSHTIRVSGANSEPFETQVVVPTGPVTIRFTLPALTTKPPTREAGVQATPRNPNTTVTTSNASPQQTPAPAPRVWPWVFTGVGVLGLAAGAILSVTASQTYADSNKDCRTPTLCNRAGLERRDSANVQAGFATGAVTAGGVSLALGTLLFLLRDPPPTASSAFNVHVHVSAQATGLDVSGVF